MTFRGRLVMGGLIVSLVPVLVLGLLVRWTGVRRLSEANEQRMSERGDQLVESWRRGAQLLEARLETLREMLEQQNEVRIAVRAGGGPALQVAVARYANSSGLGVVYVLDGTGTILAASQFPGDAGRRDGRLAALADHPGAPVVTTVSFPASDRTVLARAERLQVGGVAVIAIVAEGLPALGLIPAAAGVSLLAEMGEGAGAASRPIGSTPVTEAPQSDPRPSPPEFQGRRHIGQVLWQGWEGGDAVAAVTLVMAWRDPLLADLVRSYERALILLLAGAAVLALFLGRAMSRRLSDPVERLAATARRVHLGRLDESFGRGGGRELDRLGFFLNGMMQRIREGVTRVKEAEKRATLGELARQVNHDVRNGLVPIRNVMDHLSDAHRGGPEELAGAFKARSATVEASLEYLGDLADQYRAVAVHGARECTDLRAVALAVIEANRTLAPEVRVVGELGRDPAWVEMDGVSLRRVVENLIGNAVAAVREVGAAPESLDTHGPAAALKSSAVREATGVVRVTLAAGRDQERPCYRLSVSDDGPGIPDAVLDRVFEPFFTTRQEGTGLGLAIARRLVRDVGGSIALESEEGRGTRVSVQLMKGEPR